MTDKPSINSIKIYSYAGTSLGLANNITLTIKRDVIPDYAPTGSVVAFRRGKTAVEGTIELSSPLYSEWIEEYPNNYPVSVDIEILYRDNRSYTVKDATLILNGSWADKRMLLHYTGRIDFAGRLLITSREDTND